MKNYLHTRSSSNNKRHSATRSIQIKLLIPTTHRGPGARCADTPTADIRAGMLTVQTRDGTGAEGETAAGVAFAVVFDVVVGVECWCWLGGQGCYEGAAELGRDAVVSYE